MDTQIDFIGGGGQVRGGYFGDPGAGPADQRCATCEHCVLAPYHNRNYYKCGLGSMSHSTASDIRLKSPACQHWERSV